MQLITLFGALALATVAASQNTTQTILAICGAQHDACDVAPNANHAYCAATYFGCLSEGGESCGCIAVQNQCAATAANIFDCAEPLAECTAKCQAGSKSSSSSISTLPTSTSTSSSLPTTSSAPGTVASLLASCGAKHDACDVAPGANHAYCASQYFSCLDPAPDACGCSAASASCLEHPPTGNIFDCGPAIATCALGCKSNSTITSSSSATITSSIKASATVTSAHSYSNSSVSAVPPPTTVVTSTQSGSSTGKPGVTTSASSTTTGAPVEFTGAAIKNGASVAAALLAGAALFL